MKILITSNFTGIGNYLNDYFTNNHDVILFNDSHIDICDKQSVSNVITSVKPDIVIHTLEVSDIDLCERDENLAYSINTIGTFNIAYSCNLLNIPIVYTSTSYVFDGKKQNAYYETDIPNPINTYGKTKLGAEQLIRTICHKNFIIRTSWIFGYEQCFVNKIIKNKEVPIFMCSNEIGNPTYAQDLCYCIDKIISSNQYGIYNCANSNPVSKAFFVKTIFNELNITKEVIEMPCNFFANTAQRPKNSSLNTTLIKNSFNLALPNWYEILNKYLKK